MLISEETKTLVQNISDNTEKSLKNMYDVSVLIELGKIKDKETFNELIFTAKYVNGLKSVLSRGSINGNEYVEKMFNEFNTALQKFMDNLKSFVSGSKENIYKFFNDKYFQLNQESITNTMELIGDLSTCKEYFNEHPGEAPEV